jgi:gliding motility-associated lipoprotein GldH
MNKYILLGLLLFCFSCHSDIVFEEEKDVNINGWKHNELISFKYNSIDTSGVFDLLLIPEHSQDFSYQNLYVNIETIFPGGESADHRVSLNLASVSGGWEGDCSSDYCTPIIILKKNARFLSGPYTFNISQMSREESLNGINSLKLILQATNEE